MYVQATYANKSPETPVEKARAVLQKCVDRNANGLFSILLQNLDRISLLADEGAGVLDPDLVLEPTQKGRVPKALQRFIDSYSVQQLLLIDQDLQSQGINSETIEFYSSGFESIALKIKHIDQVFFKLSISHNTAPHQTILRPYAASYLGPEEVAKERKVRLWIVPYLSGEYQSYRELGLSLDQITQLRSNEMREALSGSDGLAVVSHPNTISIRSVVQLLKAGGIEFDDIKPANLRFHPKFPDCPFIIDRGATSLLPDTFKRPKLTAVEGDWLGRYEKAQDQILRDIISDLAIEDNFMGKIIEWIEYHKQRVKVIETLRTTSWTTDGSFKAPKLPKPPNRKK